MSFTPNISGPPPGGEEPVKMINPTTGTKVMDILNSVYRVLTGNVGFGAPISYDNAGNGLTFNTDNMNGVLIRIGPVANPNELPNYWSAGATVITHNLNRKAIGFIIVSKDRACDIFTGSPAVGDLNTITLHITDDTADTVLFIF